MDYSSYFANPPSDINSQEYREWYEQYCSYYSYYTQQQQQQTPSESNVKSKKVTIQTGPHDQDYFEQYLKDSNDVAEVQQPVEQEKKSSDMKETDKSDDPTKKRKPNEPGNRNPLNCFFNSLIRNNERRDEHLLQGRVCRIPWKKLCKHI